MSKETRDLEVRVLKRMEMYRGALMQIERVASRFRSGAAAVPEEVKRGRGRGFSYEDGASLVAQILGNLAKSALDEGSK